MKDLHEFILEQLVLELKGNKIDDNWITNRKPVMTRDGRPVLIEKIDYSEVPNIIIGKVSNDDKIFDFKWNDDGTCIFAQDRMGNPCSPTENDRLVKAC